jgi:hypothetical protein
MADFQFSYEGDREAALRSLDFADSCGKVVTGLKTNLGIDRMARSFEAPDGSQIYVIDYEFIKRIHIIPPGTSISTSDETTEVELPEERTVGVADYVSGAVMSTVIDTEELFLPGDDPDEDPPERQVIRNLRITERTQERIPYDMARHKLAVQEHPIFTPITSGSDSNIYSQHRVLRSGFYTGAMRPLIQVLLGVGRVKSETYEERWVKANNKALLTGEDLGSGTEDMRSAFGLFESKDKEEDELFKLQITYDYRWNRTHGISWGADGKAYLVEIGQRGVLVRPLPVDPISTTKKGRERYEALYPELFDETGMEDHGGSFFDLFGGFPTGATMATGTEQLEDYVRAGEIVRALDASEMSEVYSKSPYSSAMGWAFHPRGREAHNTCYGYAENGVKEGYHYAVTIDISAVEDRPPEEGASAVIAQLGLSGVNARKALRMTSAQAQQILWIQDGEAAREAFDALTVTPDVRVNARLRVIKKGFLFYPGPLVPNVQPQPIYGVVGISMVAQPVGTSSGGNGWTGHPQIKFAEPLLPGSPLLSADFTAEGVSADKGPRCDTPVFVCFKGSSLTVVNYSWRFQPPGAREDIDTRQPCQFDGTWQSGHNTEGARTHGNFYSNDVDWREDIFTEGGHLSTTTGTFITKLPFLSFCAFFAMHSVSSWEYWYSFESSWRSTGSRSLGISVAVPANDRSIYLIAKMTNANDVREGSSYSAPSVMGHGSGRAPGVVYNFVFHWTGVCRLSPPDGGPITCELREHGSPFQVESCWQDSISVADTPYSPCGTGVFALSARYGEVPTGESWSRTSDPSREVGCEIRLYGGTHISGKVTKKEFKEGKDPEGAGGMVDFYSLGMSSWWWKPSPDKEGNMAYMRVNINDFGTPLIVYEPDFDALNPITEGSPESMHLGLYSCYVGWVA